MGGGWSKPRPLPLYPRQRAGTYCIGNWVGPRAGQYGWWNPPPGFDSRTVQPVASRYTHCAIQTHISLWVYLILFYLRVSPNLHSPSGFQTQSVHSFPVYLQCVTLLTLLIPLIMYNQTRYLNCLPLCRTNEESNSSIWTEYKATENTAQDIRKVPFNNWITHYKPIRDSTRLTGYDY